MYQSVCSGFKYNFGSLGSESYQNAWETVCWSTHHLMWLPAKRDLIGYAIFENSLCHFHKGMKVGRLWIIYLNYVLYVEILILMTENLLKVACCDTALYFSEWNYYIPFSTLTNEVFVVVSYNSYYSWLTIFWLILPPEFWMIVRKL